MSNKYSRLDMFGAINLYCIKNDLCIKYLEKKRKKELEAIIKEYDMNIDELLIENAKQNDLLEIEMQESKIKQNQGIINITDKIKMLMSLLNDEQKEKFFEFCDSQKSNQDFN
jgi:hypothetical protein